MAASGYHGKLIGADGHALEPHQFDKWGDQPVLTLEEAMKSWD